MTAKNVEQLERTKRYLNRFSDMDAGISHTKSSANYDDFVYAFSQNCYHLKDWIKNDPSCNSWSDVEGFINSNTYLQICADLCNGLKHLQLTKPRSTENPQFSGNYISLNINESLGGSTEVGVAVKYKIAVSSGDIDAFQLAKNCVSAWESFIASNT